MVLPLLLGALGSSLGPSLGIGALAGGAIGSGLGTAFATGDLEKGIMAGFGAFMGGGSALGKLAGGMLTGGGSAPAPVPLPAAASKAPPPRPANMAAPAASPLRPPVHNGIPNAVPQSIMRDTKSFMSSPTGSPPMTAVGGTLGTAPTGIENFDASQQRRLRGFVSGGVVSALGPGKLSKGGIASLDGMNEQKINAPKGMDAPSGGNEKDVVVEAIRAIKGQVEDPRVPLGRFLALYGEDALRDLVDKVQSGAIDRTSKKTEGKIEGSGDGMDDRIPAKIDKSGEDVLLADSEYIIPADVVSHLGNGSSDAGAKVLDQMLDRVREARTGNKEQAKQIKPKTLLPA